jgi:hypothetical protein
MNKLICGVALTLLSFSTWAADLSLAALRAKYLDKRVIVLPGVPSQWGKVVEEDGHYTIKRFQRAESGSLAGEQGTVVSLEEHTKTEGKLDAFGKPIVAEKIIGPYFDIVVKLDNGSLIGQTTYETLLKEWGIQSLAEAEKQQREVQARLDKLINKTLYKTGYTRLLEPTLSLDEVSEKNNPDTLPDRTIENLTPMRVRQAKVIPARHMLLIVVDLPTKETRLMVGNLNNVQTRRQFPSETETEMLNISAEPSIPAKFTKRERDAIKRGEIFSGMSQDALWWSWGFPDKSNDWGSGGEQAIYGGHTYVYVKQKIVSDWQQIAQ